MLDATRAATEIVVLLQRYYTEAVLPLISRAVPEHASANSGLAALLRAVEDTTLVVLRKCVDAFCAQVRGRLELLGRALGLSCSRRCGQAAAGLPSASLWTWQAGPRQRQAGRRGLHSAARQPPAHRPANRRPGGQGAVRRAAQGRLPAARYQRSGLRQAHRRVSHGDGHAGGAARCARATAWAARGWAAAAAGPVPDAARNLLGSGGDRGESQRQLLRDCPMGALRCQSGALRCESGAADGAQAL